MINFYFSFAALREIEFFFLSTSLQRALSLSAFSLPKNTKLHFHLVENSPKGPKTEQTKSKQREERDGVIMLSSSGQKSKRIKSERHEFFFGEWKRKTQKKCIRTIFTFRFVHWVSVFAECVCVRFWEMTTDEKKLSGPQHRLEKKKMKIARNLQNDERMLMYT